MTFNTDLCLTNTEVTIDSYNNNYVTDVPKCIIYEPTSMNRIAHVQNWNATSHRVLRILIQHMSNMQDARDAVLSRLFDLYMQDGRALASRTLARGPRHSAEAVRSPSLY